MRLSMWKIQFKLQTIYQSRKEDRKNQFPSQPQLHKDKATEQKKLQILKRIDYNLLKVRKSQKNNKGKNFHAITNWKLINVACTELATQEKIH